MSVEDDANSALAEVTDADNSNDHLPAIAPEEVDTARGYADASRAASTRRMYDSDWRRFAAWCRERGLAMLPADPRVVAVLLAAEAAAGSAPATVGRRVAAIGWMHRRAGLQPPQQREGAAAILEVLAGIRRSHGQAPERKQAADADVLRDMLRATSGEHLRAVRDRALLAFGMAGAFRRSEWGPKATLPHLLVVLAKPRRRLKSHNDAAIQLPSRSDPHIAITTDLHRPRTGCF